MTAATPSIRGRPDQRLGPLTWIRRNLFNTWYNAILTIIALWIIYQVITGVGSWLLQANWAPVTTSPILYAVGQYPVAELWRIGVSIWIVSLMFGLSWALWGNLIRNFVILMALGFIVIGIIVPFNLENVSQTIIRIYFFSNVAMLFIGFGIGHTPLGKARWVLVGWILSLPIIVVLLHGISDSETLPPVETTLWGGLMLNLLLAGIGITASFPIGVLLALGRRSSLPVVKSFSTMFIEIVRGVPLVSILFMASIMLPLFLPEDVRIDRLVRALIGITFFSAAYVAENVRGGLQAIPLGQYDAAKAIGLNSTLTTVLIVLPQALRLVIPAIVGQFIALFKDTTLVVIVGLIEILGIGRSIVSGNPEWVGAQAEVYIFIAAVFWVFTYSMSYSSRRLEKSLGVGER